MKNPRDLWSPKRKETTQCASCPFRDDNDAQFGTVLKALAKSSGVKRLGSKVVKKARAMIKAETAVLGDFCCHATVYGPDMVLRSAEDFRQCPGASKYYREQGLLLRKRT